MRAGFIDIQSEAKGTGAERGHARTRGGLVCPEFFRDCHLLSVERLNSLSEDYGGD
jgi:hypothetical protein